MSNGDHLKRPDTHLIKAVYDRLYHSGTTLSRIKDNVLGGRFLNQTQNQSQNVIVVPGRSIVWKTFLLNTEPLKPDEFLPLGSIRSARYAYREAMLDKMRAPDGSYEEHFVVPGSYEAPNRESHRQPSSRDLVTNNPLSLDSQNPWTDWFTALELRKTILQDVERTFPDIDYFRHPRVQYQLTNILYLYSIIHAHIGYRQGMHELLAPIYYAVDYDSVSTAPKEDGDDDDDSSRTYLSRKEVQDYSDGARDFLEMCDRAWVSADAYALFDAVMAGAGKWYEWRENPAAASTLTGAGGAAAAGGSISSSSISTPTSSAFASHVNMNVAEGQVNPANYVAPIVQTCGQIQSTLLKSVDPILAQALQRSGIEPQIYGIRWLRLLFTREFPLADAMLLWDGLFACDTSLDLVPWICVAMLVRIRNQLVHGDYSAKLTCLLHYPPLPGTSHEGDGDSENEEKGKDDGLLPYHITLLLRQALAFQMAPTSSTGSSIVSENRNMLGIPLEVAVPASAGATFAGGSGRQSPHPHHYQHQQQQRSDPARRLHLGSAGSVPTPEGRAPMLESAGGASHARNQSAASIPEMLARGLLDRGESLGINKTVMSAYSEFRKNFPDLASSLVRSPTPSDALSSFPLSVERPIEERPPWEPRPRLEVESELAELRKRDRLLGQSVSRIVDVLLLQDSAASASASGDTRNDRDDGESIRRQRGLQERKREALENLAYVRDLLMGGQVGETDEERLFGEEEARRRKRERQKQQQSTGVSSESKSTISRSTVEAPSIPKPSASATSAPHSTSFPRKMTSHPLSPGPAAGTNAPRHPPSSRSGMTTTGQSPWQQTDSHRPPLSTSSSSSKLRDMAPWNRTPSNFGADNQDSTAVPMLLPQLPPRTSSTLHTASTTHRPPAAAIRTSSSAAGNNSAKKKTDQPPPVQQDPLGVL